MLKEPAGPKIAEPKGYAVALILTLIGVIGIGVFSQPFYNYAMQAAAVLLPHQNVSIFLSIVIKLFS